MPSSINAYRQEIENALYNNPFVHEQKIFLDDRSEVWFLRGDVRHITPIYSMPHTINT
ncbi:MAG: hypothetical protein MAG431_02138 [Chloroflexi bacterium]|nr:hypothetical protein [Chloroflexota bacterium]